MVEITNYLDIKGTTNWSGNDGTNTVESSPVEQLDGNYIITYTLLANGQYPSYYDPDVAPERQAAARSSLTSQQEDAFKILAGDMAPDNYNANQINGVRVN